MVFSYGFESATYNPINMGHASLPSVGPAGPTAMPNSAFGHSNASKKRKAFDDDITAGGDSDYIIRPKLSLPRSAGLVFNGDAQFHPLPADVNQAMLAQLGHNPFTTSNASSSFVTPSSSSGSVGYHHEHKSPNCSDYFSTAARSQYPDIEPYPSTSPSSSYGILGPAPGRHNSFSEDGMDVDGGSNAQKIHGAHCKSIPQLCVRYNHGNASELWATCPDCGACSKVESSQPASNLCYSP
ncbi:uncharacterized protein UBRO_03883 [Ustilago bromivora]|uniref:Uncharacterized protein n=1 Tax=Ustilago bromivora TaxID=307758 RepID=A0A1K0FWQ9_9BASI|nr:uncharacterized protein UBRO_03883 [Ustilago bromivora]SYW75068.1 uncharacterized protein UBRO2_00478 [Ustilago bromivora]